MTKEEMTVHQALCELKTLKSRIDRALNNTFAFANKHSNKVVKGIDIDQYCEEIKSAYQQANDLIKRREAIKKAVVLSNATTKVVVSDVEMTVAEAIEMKSTGIVIWTEMLNSLMSDLNRARHECTSNNENALEHRANEYIQSLYGNTDLKNASQEIQKVREDFIKAQTYEIVDPIKIADKIESLQDMINKFTVNVDSALSVSNALTKIVIEY